MPPAAQRRSLARSNAHFERASRALPLGVSSNFRYWGEDKTIYIDHGRGGRITDIDGNRYVDYRMGYGPGILGYADERVDEAARAGMDVGGVFALSTEREYAVAQRIRKMVPAAELEHRVIPVLLQEPFKVRTNALFHCRMLLFLVLKEIRECLRMTFL